MRPPRNRPSWRAAASRWRGTAWKSSYDPCSLEPGGIRGTAAKPGACLPHTSSLQCADEYRCRDAGADSRLGRESLLLSDQHPDQGCRHPGQLHGSGRAPLLGAAHSRSRRLRRGSGRDRVLAAAGGGGGTFAGGGGGLGGGIAWGAIRSGCLREFCAPRAVAGGCVLIADRAFRAGDSQAASCELAAALSLDRPRRPAVLSKPGQLGAPRCRIRLGRDSRALRYTRPAGARARKSEIQTRRAVADERCDGAALYGPGLNQPVIDAASRPAIERGLRLQWEAAQNAHVLLYPDGMIKLNGSAGEILKRCDGVATIAGITAALERAFAAANLFEDVIRFISMAVEKKWLQIHT